MSYFPDEFRVSKKDAETSPSCKLISRETISAPDGACLLLGKIDCEGSIRSLLLRTTNNGSEWKELSPSFVGADLFYPQFISAQEGFLVASHTREGPGEDTLLTTKDAGQTWKTVSVIPKGESPWLAALTTFTASRSEVVASFIKATPEGLDKEFSVVSQNKGRTWSTPRLSEKSSRLPKNASHKNHPAKNCSVNIISPRSSIDFRAVNLIK